MTTQNINLNLIPNGINPVIHVSQYDKGQTLIFYLYENTVPFEIPSDASVTILGTKPDKTGFQYACEYDDNVVTATLEQQMSVIAGEVPAEIRIEKGDELIGSLNFIIDVEEAALRDDTVISETDLPLIEEAIEELGHVPEIIAEMEDLSEDSEAWANGTRGGVPVASDDPAYHKNSKYWSEQLAPEVSNLKQALSDLGLTVVDGKLCAVYNT